jgi:ABC-type multidrug transport system fused ATPase/permease subunit
MNKTTGSEPLAEYRRRLNAIADSTNRYRRRDKVFAAAKLSLGILIVLAAIWLVKYHAAWLYLLLLPILLFVVLAILHERILKRMRCDARLQSYYNQGIARIENRWAGIGETGERFLDPSHPYARDLDLFGAGSLFQLLCTARTSSGEQTLAAWLMTAAPVPEIAARQEAVQELAPKIDLRERLVLAGEEVKKTVHPEALIAWSENEQPLNRASIRLATLILTTLWLLSLLAWWRWDWMAVALAMSLINFGVSYKLRSRMNRAAEGVDGAQHDLALLAGILKIIEAEAAAAPKIVQLQSRLSRSGVPASQAIAALSKRVEWLESNDNWFVKIFDPFIFYFPHCVMAINAWRARHGAAIRDWLSVTGEVEALTSFALYAYEHPTDTFPQMLEGEPYLDAEGLAHPLLARESAVANNLKLDRNLQLLVISGPNMAGKSTFIRSIGINAVLAQAGAPVCARSMTLSSLQIAASICILDSLQGGLSRFYAEISRLKQIDELSKRDTPVLFLLDELLSGTNSYDRRIGTESFVRSLLSRGAIGLVTTHDLALAEIAERIGTTAANFHFEDTFEDGKLHFDYKLTPGIVQTTNALLLMRSIGLDV